MDEVIYILLAVAWVAYSIYNAKQKKKQREIEAQTAADERQEYESAEPEKPQRSIFEELLNESDFEEFQEFEEKETVAETVLKQEIPFQYRKSDIFEPHESIGSDRLIASDAFIQAGINDTEITKPSSDPELFNLRKAVIYSTILERPYH